MKRENGITLIALVITIVVLIILAGVAISLSIGENGIFKKAEYATEEYANEQTREEEEIAQTVNSIDYHASVGGTRDVTYCTTPATTTSTASITNPCVVIENYRDGAQWYRVWSDGWIEQGGLATGIGKGKSIELLKQFSNTNYTVTHSLTCSNTNANVRTIIITSKSNDKFDVISTYANTSETNYSTAQYLDWYACGY